MAFTISLMITVFSLMIAVIKKLHLTIPAIFFFIVTTVVPRPEVPYWIKVTIGILFLASIGLWGLFWLFIIATTIFDFFGATFALVKKPKPEEYDAVCQVRYIKAQGRSLKGMSFDRDENLIDSKTGKPVDIWK